MTLKKYKKIKLIVTIVIAIIFSQSVIRQNFIIPISTLLVASLVLIFLRRQVKEVVNDERDYLDAGKSATLAIQIYAWIATVSMFILYSLRGLNPGFEPVALTLAFSTCILIFIYGLIFNFKNKAKFSKNKKKYIIFAILVTLFFAFFTLRIFSGEESWICQNGQWVKHGNPSFPAPSIPCK